MRDFIWSENEYTNTMTKVAWEDVTKPKVEGRLGIRKLKDMNNALMEKWTEKLRDNYMSMWKHWAQNYLISK